MFFIRHVQKELYDEIGRSLNFTCGSTCTYPVLGMGALLAYSLLPRVRPDMARFLGFPYVEQRMLGHWLRDRAAADTPAAAPSETKSRLSWSLRKDSSALVSNDMDELPPWLSPAARMAPVWTMGPSLPRNSPEATDRTIPTTLTISVRTRSTCGSFTPFRYALTCARSGSELRQARDVWPVQGTRAGHSNGR